MAKRWVALPDGIDPGLLRRQLAQAQESFLATGDPGQPVRPLVLDSWRRSVASGVDAELTVPPVYLLDDAIEEYRRAHPLGAAMPLIRRLLTEAAAEAGMLVVVTDAEGCLLWVEGGRDLRSRAESMTLVPGSVWTEQHAGTNAVGVALAVKIPNQIFGAEHFRHVMHPWSCAGVPVHDLSSGAILGAVNVAGGDDVASTRTMALVQATVSAVESELQLARLRERLARPGRHARGRGLPAAVPTDPQLTLRLEVLGRDQARVRLGDLEITLSPRHSELLLLLANRPSGVTVERLAVELSEHETNPVTIRAEMSRLRRILGEGAMSSRPYRINVPVSSDVDDLRLRLVRGAVRKALAGFAGPVLPRSQAPGVVELRDDLLQRVRSAVLANGSLDVLLAFAETEWGYHDFEVWQRVLTETRPGSPKRALALARIRTLSATLGDPAGATRLQPFRR